MRNDLTVDTRFANVERLKKVFSEFYMFAFGKKELEKIRSAAVKLEIPNWETIPAVDTLYEIACRLSIFETEVVSPQLIMDKIDEFLKSDKEDGEK